MVLPRWISLASAVGRLSIGIGLFAMPRKALAALGFSELDSQGLAVARIAGGRDIAMGAETLLALGDPDRLRRANLLNAAADTGDAAIFAAALAVGDEQVRRAARRGLPGAAVAAAGGVAAAVLLSRRPR
jgi:hypothetical protein